MNDTSLDILERWKANLELKTAEERLEMACSMFEFSRCLVSASLLEEDPTLTEKQLQEKIFLRFYSGDFSSETLERIRAGLFA